MTDENGKTTAQGGGGTSMDSFFTAPQASEGIRMPLHTPDGTKTEHWIHIIGVDSDAFRLHEAKAKRVGAEIALIEDADERELALLKLQRELAARLVKGWSFEQECTFEAVVDFFTKAPQVANAVNYAAANRRLFQQVKLNSC